MIKYVSKTEKDNKLLADALAAATDSGQTLAFFGGMGAGKTTFIKTLVKAMGIEADVSSPTFAIMNRYENVRHFDMYRVSCENDLESTGFFDRKNEIDLIEWPENIERFLGGAVKIEIRTGDDGERSFLIDGGEAFEAACNRYLRS